METKVTFENFSPEDSAAFKRLNLEWLKEFFYVENYDRKVLDNPKKYILDPGGYILTAKADEKILGVAALVKVDARTYELTKMAVSKIWRGKKIGQRLLAHTLAFAQKKGVEHLILYSSRKLKNAIYIYGKFGFREIPLEKENPYERADIKMIFEPTIA